jgi:hypothetical protein
MGTRLAVSLQSTCCGGGHMDRKLVSIEDHEIDYLARKHGTTAAKVKEIIRQTGSRSRRQVEEALDKHFRHQPKKEHAG